MSDTAVDYAARLQQQLASMTQPLVDQYKELDAEIQRREEELKAIRATRSQLRTIVRGISPDLVPHGNRKNGKKTKKTSGSLGPSADRIKAFGEWLQEHRETLNEDGFWASGLVKHPDIEASGIEHQSGISKALNALHEQGLVTLDRIGRGKSKVYKVA